MSLDYLATDAVAITPHDTTVQPRFVAIYVGGSGNVRVKTKAGTDTTFVGLPAGTTIPLADVELVYSTNTTATYLVGYKA